MQKYFIHENQQQAGPFTYEELATKNIKAGTPIWYEGLADWIRADQIEELKGLLQTTPPPFSLNENQIPNTPSQQRHTYQTHTPTTKRSGGSVMKAIGITAAVIILIVVVVAATGNNEKINDLLGNDSYQQKVMTVEEIERADPARFLEATGKYRQTLLGNNFRIYGEVINSATVANYKDITIRVTFLSPTDTEIQTKDYTIYDYFPAHATKKFEMKIERPAGCTKLNWETINALPY